MPWSGGSFTRANGDNGWTNDANLGIGIEAGLHDTQDNDFKNGINQCLNKDGSNSATGNLNLGGYLPTNIGSGTAAAPAICAGNDVNTGIFSPAADQIGIATNGIERMRIDSGGNLMMPGGNHAFRVRVAYNPSAPNETYTNLSQNWNYNTNTADEALNGTATISIQGGASNYSAITFATNVNNTQPAERMRIAQNGYIGINTASPNGFLSVNIAGSADDFVVGREITGANYIVSKRMYDQTTIAGANVAIESTAGSYPIRRVSSSIKYKKDIVNLDPNYADKLHQFRPVFFKSKCFGDHPEWTHYGFIAEEIAAIEPRFVQFGYQPEDYEEYTFVDEEGKTQTGHRLKVGATGEPEGVYYDRIVTFLTSVVQRQEQRIKALEARVAELEP